MNTVGNFEINYQQTPKENIVKAFCEDYKFKFTDLWWEIGADHLCLSVKHSRKQQLQKEKELEKFIKAMGAKMRKAPDKAFERALWMKNLKDSTRSFGKNTLGFTEAFLDILFMEGFTQSTNEFVREAKEFDSEFKLEDTFQAIRNVWIMNSIQVFLNKKVAFSPSIFAYSMLYPYTDNYLDDPKISKEEKMMINERFKRRLSGEGIEPSNSYEMALFMLVQRIEDQYPREGFSEIYQSLLGIHNAQEQSLLQQDESPFPYEKDIVGISFEKGGMSVLADAYLVNGKLTEQEAQFMFGFGVVLQLADDLQDVITDVNNRHMTIFSQIATKWKLDNLTDKLFNFIDEVIAGDETFDSPQLNELKGLIQYNCHFLMFQAIAKNKKFYTRAYLKKIEVFSPFRFSTMRGLYKKLEKEYYGLNKKKDRFSIGDAFIETNVMDGLHFDIGNIQSTRVKAN